jgi:hypothetical protein
MKISVIHPIVFIGPLVLAGFAPLTSGCAGPDLVMANPIVAGHLPPNEVVREHGFAESNSGLPVGAMADRAVIDVLDANQVCVKVSLHELSAIDLTNAKAKFESSSTGAAQPTLEAQPPAEKTYTGLVPHTVQTGTRLVCKNSADQTTCETQPVMQTTMVPGPVTVFTSNGRFCAPNLNLVTPTTTKLALDISTPTAARSMWGYGHGSKGNTFRWEFK